MFIYLLFDFLILGQDWMERKSCVWKYLARARIWMYMVAFSSETHIDVGRCSHKDPIYKAFLVCELLVNIRFIGVIYCDVCVVENNL